MNMKVRMRMPAKDVGSSVVLLSCINTEHVSVVSSAGFHLYSRSLKKRAN